MEVAVITRHAIANYGSLLQAAATQNALEALGHNCRIIDYVRPGEVCTQLHKYQLQQNYRIHIYELWKIFLLYHAINTSANKENANNCIR